MAKRIDLNEHKIKFNEIQETNDRRNNIKNQKIFLNIVIGKTDKQLATRKISTI